MARYNTSFLENTTSPYDLIVGLNNIVGYDYMFGNIILFAFSLIFLAFSIKYGLKEVLVVDMFLSMILAILLWASGLILATTIMVPMVLFLIVLVFYLFS